MISTPRILIVRLSSIGDVLHCTPVARTLKEQLPNCHLTWLVGQASAAVLESNPYVDIVHIWPREQWELAMRAGRFKQARLLWRQLHDFFTKHNYDIALDIHGLFLSGAVTAASGAQRRIGLANTKELNHLFMTERALPSVSPHVIDRYLTILQPLDIITSNRRMTFTITNELKHFAHCFLASYNVQANDTIIAINAVTTWQSKNWPAENFAQVIRQLSRQGKIILCGAPADQAINDSIITMADIDAINAAGKTSLPQLAALLQRCNVLVTGDTGPLHIAVAIGTPTVSLFGPTAPQRFGPLEPGHIILESNTACAPCYKTVCQRPHFHCLNSISPELVIAHTQKLLATPKQGE